MAAECCGAFVHFGGFSAQLNLVAIVLNLCITESVNLGLSYFRILSSRLEENARMRVLSSSSFAALLNSEQLDVKEQARREERCPQRTVLSHHPKNRRANPSSTRQGVRPHQPPRERARNDSFSRTKERKDSAQNFS